MATQHTLGARIVRANDDTGLWDVLQDGMWLVAFESESLAYEFAAAPELLDSLQECVDAVEDSRVAKHQSRYVRARAAIAQAQG